MTRLALAARASVMAEMESRTVLGATLTWKPVNVTHSGTRTLAEHLGVGTTTLRTVWRTKGLKPCVNRTFKVWRDPRFKDKPLEGVGLYLNTP